MADGAHTHHNPGSGLTAALIAAVVVALCSGAIAAALTALIHLLLIVLATIVGFTAAAGLAWTLLSHLHHARQAAQLATPATRARTETSPGEIAAIRAQLDDLTRHIATLSSASGAPAALPAETHHHQHLHLHGIDPASALPTVRPRGGDRW